LLVRSFIDAGTDILKTKAKLIKTPILYSHADADPINAYKSTVKAFELTPSTDKEMKNWPELYHECKLTIILSLFYYTLLTLFFI
jgi:acylglycerol lipase